ncbi:Fungal specific transcription factor domain-containing protein [Cladophialophora immunda]|nr:Fungal specific transcription factor domain-containing protein [Cladophialophora immunda]
MVINPEINPLSFPILQYLESSPSLLHSLQSISIAHESFFSPAALTPCLEEKARALTLLREELRQNERPPEASFFTMLILGMLSAWTDQENKLDIGQAHLDGARALIDIMVADTGSINDAFVQLALGNYIYWDQASAFFVRPQDQTPLNTPEIYHCISAMRRVFHPVVGHSTEIYYLLSTLGRYCRAIIDDCPRDHALEETLEEELLSWDSPEEDHNLHLVSDSFRKHGLIMLYRTIASARDEPLADPADCTTPHSCAQFEEVEIDGIIRQYAREILENIMAIPAGCSYHIVLALPLFTAASELGEIDADLRDEVRKRFRALFSMNRIPANLLAIDMLEEHWKLRDAGTTLSWLALALKKNWNLILL